LSIEPSPDGEWVAFIATVSEQSSQIQLKKVRVDGSAPPVAIIDWEEQWNWDFLWLKDGDLFVQDGPTKFFRLPSGGGPPKPAIPIDTGAVTGIPSPVGQLPGGRGVFLSLGRWGPRGYQQDLWLLDAKTGKARPLFENAGNAAYSPTGHVVFARGQSLMAAPFDLEKLAVNGEVTPLLDGLRSGVADSGYFQLSSDGRLLYEPGGRLGADRRLAIVEPTGNLTPFAMDHRAFQSIPSVSQDGRKVAVVIPAPKGTYETWVADRDRPGLKRVLALPNADCAAAVWSPDAKRLAYSRLGRDKDDGIYVQNSDGSGAPQAVLKVDSPEVGLVPWSWTSDGSGLLVGRFFRGKSQLLFVNVPTAGTLGTPRDFRTISHNERGARVSPDGRLVAFISDESGKFEIYVASLGPDGKVGSSIVVSGANDLVIPDGLPGWAGDSRRLFYPSNPNKVMAVTIEAKPGLSASAPVFVHDLKKLRVNAWDILPDGRLLAIQRGEGEDEVKEYNIVLNWFSELRARMAKPADSALSGK
jgi:serine/threonine-protein kinase